MPFGDRIIGVTPIPDEPLTTVDESIGNDDLGQVVDTEEANSIIDIISSNAKHDPQLEVEGNMIYKATYLKNCFSSNPLSKDRLRRVRGLSRFEENESDDTLDDQTLMIGDPILARVKDDLKICVLLNITRGKENKKTIDVNEMSNFNTMLTVQKIKLETTDDYYVCMEERIEESFNVVGMNCIPIQP